MKDASLVRKMDGRGDDPHVIRRAPGRQRPFTHDLRQAAARDVFHRKEVLSVPEADFVNSNNVRVLEAGRGGGFRAETLD